MSTPQLQAHQLDQTWTLPTIRAFLENSTMVKFMYGQVQSVDTVNHTMTLNSLSGINMVIKYGLGVPNAGERWRARRINGIWIADDISR